MSLTTLLSKATKLALNSLGDLNSDQDFLSRGTVTVNAFTENVTPSETTYTIPILLYSYKESDIDNAKILKTDMKGVLHSDNLPFGYVPSNRDSVMINSQKWNVVNTRTVPGQSVYFLQLRRS